MRAQGLTISTIVLLLLGLIIFGALFYLSIKGGVSFKRIQKKQLSYEECNLKCQQIGNLAAQSEKDCDDFCDDIEDTDLYENVTSCIDNGILSVCYFTTGAGYECKIDKTGCGTA